MMRKVVLVIGNILIASIPLYCQIFKSEVFEQQFLGFNKPLVDGAGDFMDAALNVTEVFPGNEATLEVSGFVPSMLVQGKSIGVDVSETLIVDPDEIGEYQLRGPSQFDSRIEIRNLDTKIRWQYAVRYNALSVGMVVEKSHLSVLSDSLLHLDITATLGQMFTLCPEEPYREQPVLGIGTAFITDDDILVTAGHVFTQPLSDYAVVFGFEMLNKNGTVNTIILAANVYYPEEIIRQEDDLDIAFFKVDRTINRPHLNIGKARSLKKGAGVYMIGYPAGMPEKAAVNASITQTDEQPYFFTTLDAFQGNSGSPVFSSDSNEVIGVLVSGIADYHWTGNCNVSTLCTPPYCKGEKVVRLDRLVDE